MTEAIDFEKDRLRTEKIIEAVKTFRSPEHEATVRAISQKTRIPQKDIIDLTEGDHRFIVNVAIKIGNRVGDLDPPDWTVELSEDYED